jgi:ubiquinone/menaquinone biosynthesis C-methylase UbiE
MKENKRRDSISLAELLRCPFCGGGLSGKQIELNSGFGVLSCYCDRYPVVAGIPILKKGPIGTDHQTADQVINSIEAGRYNEALLAMILPSPPSAEFAPRWIQALPSLRGIGRVKTLIGKPGLRSWRKHGVAYLTQLGDQITGRELFDFYFCCSTGDAREPYGYFAFRFGQPRHLVALSLACLIRRPGKPVLDLACGFGHITRHLVNRAEGQPVIGLDRNFFMLYIAKNWLAPEAEYVCAEADMGQPFPNGTFSTVFCSDAFHWFVGKANCAHELKRLTASHGSIILATLRNSLVDRHLPQYRGTLPPEGYEALFTGMPHCLAANSDIVARYLKKQGPSLASSTEIDRLASEPWLSLVASYRDDVFRNYGSFADWPHAEGRLEINPLYREDRRNGRGNAFLRRTFPSAWYEKEDEDCKQYEPETAFVSAETLKDLAQGTRSADVERLIEQFVVVGMPERYF